MNTPNVIKTIKNNARDILWFLLGGVGLCILLDWLGRWSGERDAAGKTILGLSFFVTLVTGLCRFVAANACAWLLGLAVAWPQLNAWSHGTEDSKDGKTNNCKSALDGMTPQGRLWVFVAVAAAELLMAAICFTR